MAFEDIILKGPDKQNMTLTKRKTVMVPYILSDKPPKEWRDYFLHRIRGKKGAADGPVSYDTLPYNTTVITENLVLFECAYNEVDIQERCRKIVEDHVAAANEWYHEVERKQVQEQERAEARRQMEEKDQREFEEFKRKMV